MGPRSQNGCLTHVANDKSDTVLVSSCTDTWLVAACSYPVIILNMCPPPNMYPCKECGTWRKNGGLEYTLITIIFVIIGGWVVWLIWQGGATQQPLLPPPSLSFTFVHRVLYLAHAQSTMCFLHFLTHCTAHISQVLHWNFAITLLEIYKVLHTLYTSMCKCCKQNTKDSSCSCWRVANPFSTSLYCNWMIRFKAEF